MFNYQINNSVIIFNVIIHEKLESLEFRGWLIGVDQAQNHSRPAEKNRPPRFNISWRENAQRENPHNSELFKILNARKRARVVSARTRRRVFGRLKIHRLLR